MTDDIFCLSEFFRQIYDDYDARLKAEELYQKTKSLDELNSFCKKIIREKRAKKLLSEIKFDKRFELRTFESFKTYNKITSVAKEKALNYIKNLEHNLEFGINLIIEGKGSIGTGKTHLASAITYEAIKMGVPSKFINIISLLSELKETFDIKPYIKTELLIIDDMGKEKPTDWAFEMIYGIINERYEKMLPTIITTEGGIEDITSHYNKKGRGILSRLCENFILIRLNGEDMRIKRT